MAKLILFDVDGTLIHSGGAGFIALTRTMRDLTGIEDGFRGVNCAGKTDVQILREAAANLAINPDDGFMAEFMALYPTHLRTSVKTTDGRLKPGVVPLLEDLRGRQDFFLGLLTGNVEAGARIKLEKFDLNRFFPVGAFGSDREQRNLLVPVAVLKLMETEHVTVKYSDCIVIGDTPLDVECAHAHGALSIAVATGPYSAPELEAANADLVLTDLTDARRIVRWIREG